ncbi:unnamed protein product [Rhizophagus irregularis]|uniref:MIR domain-containing protein n=1 Tax=Rhizophagus irregularis TaxID=588596 RepID=A0A915YYR7_9GLOM|nr:hypothetical protein GLOIN_2v1543999 [Rhizophagus irregularis DAOM 181602=DAOM 197198]CAB4479948.1 unnamed protein product [Rhizophagus irregularis]CAB5355636.1 unnamed protein product [Rhizophagus irregularis]
MDFPKYDGNIHPDEWINDIQKYDSFWKARYALKHVATGKYLGTFEGLNYETGSKNQLISVQSLEPDPDSWWKIQFSKEIATCTDTPITLQHAKSNVFLGIYYWGGYYYICNKSPSTNHTEVFCIKSNYNVNMCIKKCDNNGNIQDDQVEFLRSHDIQFTIGNDAFQEVVCHNERLGGNDEWCIELIHEVKI